MHFEIKKVLFILPLAAKNTATNYLKKGDTKSATYKIESNTIFKVKRTNV